MLGAKCIVVREPVINRNVTATSVGLGGGALDVGAAGAGIGVDVETSSGLAGAGVDSESAGRLGGSVARSCRGEELAVGGARVGACESSSADVRGWVVVVGASEVIVIKPCF